MVAEADVVDVAAVAAVGFGVVLQAWKRIVVAAQAIVVVSHLKKLLPLVSTVAECCHAVEEQAKESVALGLVLCRVCWGDVQQKSLFACFAVVAKQWLSVCPCALALAGCAS